MGIDPDSQEYRDTVRDTVAELAAASSSQAIATILVGLLLTCGVDMQREDVRIALMGTLALFASVGAARREIMATERQEGERN